MTRLESGPENTGAQVDARSEETADGQVGFGRVSEELPAISNTPFPKGIRLASAIPPRSPTIGAS
jgi:hypothetical protein